MSDIPLRSVVGVIDGHAAQRILDGEALPRPLGGVELRADLVESPTVALEVLSKVPRRLPVLFTYRIREQGGTYDGDDASRIDVFRDALQAGAAMVDAEWGSRAAELLAEEGAPLVLSHHDFDGMPNEAELARWTSEMEKLRPSVLKVVTTAGQLEHSARMLRWIDQAPSEGAARVGFAMGEKGLPSRVLSVARGAPYTYGSLGHSVAPGQPTASELQNLYRVGSLTREAVVYGVVGNPVKHSLSPQMHNAQLAADRLDAVYLPILLDDFDELEPCWEPLRLRGLSVTIPFKEDACRRADRLDDRARKAGAANTLVAAIEDTVPGARMRTSGYNTDFEGVLEPLRQRIERLEGVQVAVLGNGGAARGAVEALKEAHACPTIVYRNIEKGPLVAQELNVPGRHFDDFLGSDYRVVINATSLGLKRGDPSPIPSGSFTHETLAFDMVYDPPDTAFLVEARKRGCEWISGAEMLISQGLVQYKLFTGLEARRDVFEDGFRAAQARRNAQR